MESGILGIEIRNTAQGVRNPTNDYLQSPRFIDKDWNPVPGIRNPQRGIQNPSRLSWIPLPGAMIIDRGKQGLRLRLMPLSPARPLRLSVAPHSALGSAWDNI